MLAPARDGLPIFGSVERTYEPGHNERELQMTRIPISRVEEDARLRKERLELSIAEMKLSVRTTNCLEETGILTVRDLLNATPKRLLNISNFGEKTLDEVYAALEELGFHRPGTRSQDDDLKGSRPDAPR